MRLFLWYSNTVLLLHFTTFIALLCSSNSSVRSRKWIPILKGVLLQYTVCSLPLKMNRRNAMKGNVKWNTENTVEIHLVTFEGNWIVVRHHYQKALSRQKDFISFPTYFSNLKRSISIASRNFITNHTQNGNTSPFLFTKSANHKKCKNLTKHPSPN